jgi:hypothetical protein
MILRRQEPGEQTPRVTLLLLCASIALDDDKLSLCNSFLHALGFGACRTKFDEHGPLYMGLPVPNRRRQIS